MPAVWSNDQIVANLLRDNAKWSGATVTFSFPTVAPAWSMGGAGSEGPGFVQFTEDQKEMARLALKLWDDLTSLNFDEVDTGGQITFQNSTTGVSFAHAYLPGGGPSDGSVWMNPEYDSTWGTNDLVTPEVGQWGALTYIHELGHALGFDHPGNYNGGSPTYAANALYTMDTIQYTVMSYFDAVSTGADWIASDGHEYFAQTPMLHDVLAIQALYGVDTTTRATDTRYGFNSTADSFIYDFTQNAHPIMTLWDAGGTDWLDLSGFNTASRINLNAGTYSDCDGMTGNIAIAYGCSIENAEGGSGDDKITGNALNNELIGNEGNDILVGGLGADILIGGDGDDKFYADDADLAFLSQFDGGLGDDTLYFFGTWNDLFDLSSISIEHILLFNANDPLIPPIDGTNNAETLTGTGENDIINGLAGNDTLKGLGGDDTLNGGLGNDRLDGGTGNDTVTYKDAGGSITASLAVTKAQATGGSGSDTFVSIENLIGSGFNDTLTGSSAANRIEGLDGNDTINGGAAADTMVGGNGNDTYTVDNLGDVVDETGTDGIDTVKSTVTFSLADSVHSAGTVENLVLTGSAAINGTGNGADNSITGNTGTNTLDGAGGNDTLSFAGLTVAAKVNLGLTTVQATGYGNDTILNFENVYGSSAADTFTGSNGDNILNGAAGNDKLLGGAGSDHLIGGAGADILTGGTEVDYFVFTAVTESKGTTRDTITDFVENVDKIDLAAIDAVTGGSDNAFSFIGNSAFTGVAGQLRFTTTATQTTISADINGDKTVDFQVILTGVHTLQDTDFIL